MVYPFPALLGSEKKKMTGQFWPKTDEKEQAQSHNEKLVIINKTNSSSCYKRLLATSYTLYIRTKEWNEVAEGEKQSG